MEGDVSDIEWIEKWFKKHCDGDWEHENIFRIESISNPGWSLTVDLSETPLESYNFDSGLVTNGEGDFYWIKVGNGKFDAFGDVSKLGFLIKSFREILVDKGDLVES
jgi:hypothetical protein